MTDQKSNVIVFPTPFSAGEQPPAETVHPSVDQAIARTLEKAEELKAVGVFVVLISADGTAWSKYVTAGQHLMLQGAVHRSVHHMMADEESLGL